MQDSVLDPTDILVDRHPVTRRLARYRLLGAWTAEAREIPGTIDEGVECVGLARRLAVALRAAHVLPARMMIERIAGPVEGHILGQHHRQLLVGHRHDAARCAM